MLNDTLIHLRQGLFDPNYNASVMNEYFSPVSINEGQCSYGDRERSNEVVMAYQAIQMMMTICISFILLGNIHLLRFYRPLARIVDFSLFLRFLSSILYFTFYPYDDTHTNCSEIFVGRFTKAIIMLGEMHQVYLLANVLGIGKFRLSFLPRKLPIHIVLDLLSLAVLLSFILQYIRQNTSMFVLTFSNIWSLTVSILQIYMISAARKTPSSVREHDIISPDDSSIVLFEKLSVLQSIQEVMIISSPVLFVSGLFSLYFITNLEIAILVLDEVNNFLFYIKVLIVALKVSNVEVIQDV
jgi:hypothetical protein